MTEASEHELLPNAGKSLQDPVDLDEIEYFEPVVPRPPASNPISIPKPKQRTLGDIFDEMRPELGLPPLTESKVVFSAPAEGADSAEPAQSTQISAAPASEQLPPPRVATAAQIFTWIRKALLERTGLPHDDAELFAVWTISTWLQPSLRIRPCLVITGPMNEAYRVLQVLQDLCCLPALVAGFGRSHLEPLRQHRTTLISEPNLDQRTANLLSSLTIAKSLVVAGSSAGCYYSKSTAIYTGEDPETHRILNSIHIHLTPTNTGLSPSSEQVKEIMEGVPAHLKQYGEKNLTLVKHSAWVPSGLSAEMTTIATQLGRCLVDAPALREKLVALLKAQDKQHLSDRSDTLEAVLLEAILNLIHQGKPKFLVREVADEVNRIQKARGERILYSPESIGRKLKKIGLPARHISKDGNGLEMNLATVKRAHELALVYGCAGLSQDDENLHCPHCDENKQDM